MTATDANLTDVIEREMVLNAPRTAVWAALTDPDGLAGWWCTAATVDLRPGGEMKFDFGDHGVSIAKVESYELERQFVFLWRPFEHMPDVEVPPELWTRVEYALEDHAHGTLLKLRETGFAALPEALAGRSLADNQNGWDGQLAGLRAYLAESAAGA